MASEGEVDVEARDEGLDLVPLAKEWLRSGNFGLGSAKAGWSRCRGSLGLKLVQVLDLSL